LHGIVNQGQLHFIANKMIKIKFKKNIQRIDFKLLWLWKFQNRNSLNPWFKISGIWNWKKLKLYCRRKNLASPKKYEPGHHSRGRIILFKFIFRFVKNLRNGHSPANLANSSTRQNGLFWKCVGLARLADIHKPCCTDSPDSPTFAKPYCKDSPDSPTFAKLFCLPDSGKASLANLESIG
jgi:hypothetical protein